MGFFSKHKNDNNGFIINTDDEPIKISGDKNLAPHAMTPDEVSNLWIFGDDAPDVTQTGALDSLKKRMNVSEVKISQAETIESTEKPQKASDKTENTQESENIILESTASPDTSQDEKTLIEKVKKYTIDDQGRDVSQNHEPLYRLESVAEILMNDSENAMKDLSKKYGLDIIVDDLGKTNQESSHGVQNDQPIPKSKKASPSPSFEKMVNDAEMRESKELYAALFTSEKPVENLDLSVPDISDIDTHEIGISNSNNLSNTATIRFTPIKDSKGNTNHISISNVTQYVDLGENVFEDISSKNTSQDLEQSEFEKYSPKSDVDDVASGKRLMHRLAVKKRSYFLSVIFSAVSLIALLVFLIPPVFDFIISNPKNTMLICGAFLLVSVLGNINMFADFKNLLKKRCGFDIIVSLCSVLTLALCVAAAFTHSNAYYSILLCSIILFTRSLCKFKETVTLTGNLKQILHNKPKKAVTLIDDPATTFAMARNSIDGNVLVAAQRNTNFVTDFMKYNDFSLKISGKTPLIFYFVLIFAFVSGIMAYFYYQSIFEAFYSATAISCIIAMPSSLFIDILPLAAASKKLNKKGSMISGMYGAEKIEQTNAVVINTNDIFPTGSIKLHNMKVLSDNNIDDTLLRAASLTAAINSPLESIFNQIAGTNTSYSIPTSDTIKYEKNLGISGWVNNELLFIGNRSFMQAHGISIPSLEIDKKILRKGFFPVYVATSDTACALIVIEYCVRPEIAKELRKTADLGLTILVENCDPNITEAMLCDYFDLYDDSIKIMTTSGVYMLKNATLPVEEYSAPAAYKGSGLNLVRIINCADMIKKSNKLLTVMYALFAIFGVMYFIYAAFSGMTVIPSPQAILVYELAISALSLIGFLIRKP